jgi:hypothetical protein
MMSIKSGIFGEILFEDSANQDRISGIPSLIYSVEDQRILLSQTSPPIATDDLGKRITLTYLDDNEGAPVRYRVRARLTGFTDHEIAPSQWAPALVIERETHPEACNLRTSYRIKPAQNKGLTVSLRGTPVEIVDISEGGVCIGWKGDLPLKPRDTLKLTISIDKRAFDVESRVVRINSPQTAAGAAGKRQFVSFQFLGSQAARENLLGGKIFQLERTQIKNKIR